MSDHLRVGGRLVAHAQLERYLSNHGPADEVYVFHDAGWHVLTFSRHESYSEDGTLTDAWAEVLVARCNSVRELAAHIEDRYASSSWRQLLDVADCSCDPDLYLAWATTRIERDFDAASIHVKDLAVATGFLFADHVPSPGRAIDGWESHHLNVMAAHLTELGYEVLNERTVGEANAFGDPVLGALRVRRYGHDATGVVRVDDVGEVFVRLHYPDEGEAVVPAPGGDDSL